MTDTQDFVQWFRDSTPYIHAHRERTFVLCFGGEALEDEQGFSGLIHDIALLQGLGIRLVLVHGARPQIERRLRERGAEMRLHQGLRVTDDAALDCVKEAAGVARVEIEARLSMGLANSPMAGIRIRAASGNFVTAQPLGVRDGVDFCHTGVVRKIDAGAIQQRLESGAVALIPPLGYSPTGEVFNLSAPDLAVEVALALEADKLIYLQEQDVLRAGNGQRPSHLLPEQLAALESELAEAVGEESRQQLAAAMRACRLGVQRVHLLMRTWDGALLQELFSREGVGTLVTANPLETIRAAIIDDVTGILALLEPLEKAGILVKRSRELLGTEIDRFVVVERDGLPIACAALYPWPKEAMAELACVAVHAEYRGGGRGDVLLKHMENLAKQQGLDSLFVLTTQTAHWFRERGFEPCSLEVLPAERQRLYNFHRNSKMLRKVLA